MNEFIKNFKNRLVVKVDHENIKKLLEIIQRYYEICWANTLSPMDINPFFRKMNQTLLILKILLNAAFRSTNPSLIFLQRKEKNESIY